MNPNSIINFEPLAMVKERKYVYTGLTCLLLLLAQKEKDKKVQGALIFFSALTGLKAVQNFTVSETNEVSSGLIEKYYTGSDKAAFIKKTAKVAASVGANTSDLIAVMYFESKINPQARNPYSSATGLIQFMANTAKSLGTTTAQLLNMGGVEQLDYVEKYLLPYKGKIGNLENLYLSVFYPASINWSDSKKFPQNVVAVNPIFAVNGEITKKTIRDALLKKIKAA